MSKKIEAYVGEPGFPSKVFVEYSDKSKELLDTCLSFVNHSPDGFSWGYAGSGPHQLGFAILYHYSGNNRDFASDLYKNFTIDFVANQPINEYLCINYDDITAWLYEK